MMQASRTSRLNPESLAFVSKTKANKYQEYTPQQHKIVYQTNAAVQNAVGKEKAAAIALAVKTLRAQNLVGLDLKGHPATTAAIVHTSVPPAISFHNADSFVPGQVCDGQRFSSNSSEYCPGWTSDSEDGMCFNITLTKGDHKNRPIFDKDGNILRPSVPANDDLIILGVAKEPAQASQVCKTALPPHTPAPLKRQQMFENYNAIMAKWTTEQAAKTSQRTRPTPINTSVKGVSGGAYLPRKQESDSSSIYPASSIIWATPQPRYSSPKILAHSLEEYYAMRGDFSHLSSCVDLPIPEPNSSASERERLRLWGQDTDKRGDLHPAGQNSRYAYKQADTNRLYQRNNQSQVLQPLHTRQQTQQRSPHRQDRNQGISNALKDPIVNSSEPERDFNGDIMRKGRGFDGTIKHWNVPCVNQDHVGFADIDPIASDYTTDGDKDSKDPTKKSTPYANPPHTGTAVKYTTYAQLQARRDLDTANMLAKQKAAEYSPRHTKPLGSSVSNLARHSSLHERVHFYLSTLNPHKADPPDVADPPENNFTAGDDPCDHPFCHLVDPVTIPYDPVPPAVVEGADKEMEDVGTDTEERPDWVPIDIHRPEPKPRNASAKEHVRTKDCGRKHKTPKAPKYPIDTYKSGGESEWDEVPYSGSL